MTEPLTLAQRLRLPISASMFVRKTDMMRALFAERSEAADGLDVLDAVRSENASLRDANKALTAKADKALADWSKAATSGIEDFKRAEVAEAKLAKVEAENLRLQNEFDNTDEMLQAVRSDRDRLSAELAEARAACEAALLACSLRAASMGDVVYPDDYDGPLAEDYETVARTFLASKEASK